MTEAVLPGAIDAAQNTLLQYGLAGIGLVVLSYAVFKLVGFIVKKIEESEKACKERDAIARDEIAELRKRHDALVGGVISDQAKTQIETNRVAQRMADVAERFLDVAQGKKD